MKNRKELIQEFESRGYYLQKGNKFWYYKDMNEWGVQVGNYTHSCHIDTTDIIVLLFLDGRVDGIYDGWLSNCITV